VLVLFKHGAAVNEAKNCGVAVIKNFAMCSVWGSREILQNYEFRSNKNVSFHMTHEKLNFCAVLRY